jgi:hypothetical protein
MSTSKVLCSACGHPNPPTATICGSCQSRLVPNSTPSRSGTPTPNNTKGNSLVRIVPMYNHQDSSYPPPPSSRSYHIAASECKDIKCVHCSNMEVRKITAILQSETWASKSYTSTTNQSTTTMGMYTPGRNHHVSFGQGVTTGRNQTMTNGQSQSMLASGIKPPSMPALPPAPCPPTFSYAPEEDIAFYLALVINTATIYWNLFLA